MIARRLLPCAALLLAGTPAPGQAPPAATPPAAAAPADSEDITVTGLREKEIRTIAGSFARAVLPSPRGGQYARWNAPLCPRVNGLEAALATRVAEKIRRVAVDAGARVAGAECQPNIVVSFTTGASEVAARIFAKRADAARLVETVDRDALRTAPLPVRWWNAWRIEDENGRPMTTTSTALATAVGAGEAPFQPPTGPDAVVGDSYSSSLIASHQRISLTAVTVLVDVDLATGYSLSAVTAHVAMAVLSQAPVRGKVDPALSILGLFRAPAGSGPTDLTEWDRALLKALYATPPDRPARRQASAIVATIVKERMADN
ncbi:hypothetical protein IP88_02840 [alpha proteobacterium AAP81b]|nr:hypothetical protein IP88_02840 [alpha proteobacterium AAP81b]